MSKINVITFGCRLNSYESEVIKEILNENEVDFGSKELFIFNSCAVTNEAERQLGQAIRRIKNENKDCVIGVVGCAVQVNIEKYLNMKEIDFIIGNNRKLELASYKNIYNNKVIVDNVFEKNELTDQIITGFENKARAFIQIQNGCDNMCSFCLTRLARGYSISKPPNKILEQVKKLIENGYREIVLSGVNIADYGKRLNEDINLGQLIKKILNETDLERLRISSVDVAELNDDLMDVFINESRLMPHIHLSLQSGDNTILKRMIRRHRREDVFEKCGKIMNKRKDFVIGADLIAGFPTETDEMFDNSVSIIEELPITYGHIFPYSQRPETKAALMPQVEKKVRKERAKILREVVEKNLNNLRKRINGTKQKVLVESDKFGRLENYLQVELNGDYSKNIGKIIEMNVKC